MWSVAPLRVASITWSCFLLWLSRSLHWSQSGPRRGRRVIPARHHTVALSLHPLALTLSPSPSRLRCIGCSTTSPLCTRLRGRAAGSSREEERLRASAEIRGFHISSQLSRGRPVDCSVEPRRCHEVHRRCMRRDDLRAWRGRCNVVAASGDVAEETQRRALLAAANRISSSADMSTHTAMAGAEHCARL